jgi:putative membrane protein
MKKVHVMIVLAIATVSFQACKDTKSGSGSNSAINTDTATAKVSADTDDVVFAKKAAIGGMAEVAFGKLALSKTSNTRIKDFANMMVTDHSKANNELMGIAINKNITLPATVDAEHQAKMDSLNKLSGMDFDKAYAAAMVEGHQKTLALMQTETSIGKDADLRAFAAKTASTVQIHLNAINNISAGMK